MILINLEEHKIHYAICFGLKASNNKAEYEALIEGLRLAREVNDIYLVRGEKIATYLKKAKEHLNLLSIASIEVIPQSKNSNVDALAKPALTRDTTYWIRSLWSS